MIESATGKPYEKSLQKLVLDPVKLTSTSLPMGTVISEPTFRGYVGGRLFGARTQAIQTDLFIPGGESGPPGPGLNSASLSLFRYETPCGVVYGHTGNTLGCTQFAVASPDGTRSATVSINLALNEDIIGHAVEVLNALRGAEATAVCMALDGS